jgi:hypothetical protein
MSKLNVKNGTPVSSTHLCKSCSWGQFVVGYRESDLLAICTNTNPNVVLPFKVYECSSFADKHKPDWHQMEKLAINIQPVRVSTKTSGFSAIEIRRPLKTEDHDEDEEEVALIPQLKQMPPTQILPVAQGTDTSMVERRVSGGAGSIPAVRHSSGVASFTDSAPDFSPAEVFRVLKLVA